MTLRRIIPLLVSSFLLFTHCGIAAEAFFSHDGNTVTMSSGPGGLMKIKITTGAVTKAPLPPEFKDVWIESVAQGAEGETLFLAKDAVWVWKQSQTPQIRRICSTAPAVGATDLFVATKPGTPLTDCLFISGSHSQDNTGTPTFFARKPGQKTFSPVFCRRVNTTQGGVFSNDGRLFFVNDGDLWEGGIQLDEDQDLERFGTLVGARIAPLALLNTDEGNSGGLWINQAFPAGNWIYIHLRGRHESAIIRTPLPAKTLYSPATQDFPKISSQLQMMGDLVSKTRVVVDSMGDIHGFCATMLAGEPLIFYCAHSDQDGKGDAMMLWDGAGQPRTIGHLPAE